MSAVHDAHESNAAVAAISTLCLSLSLLIGINAGDRRRRRVQLDERVRRRVHARRLARRAEVVVAAHRAMVANVANRILPASVADDARVHADQR